MAFKTRPGRHSRDASLQVTVGAQVHAASRPPRMHAEEDAKVARGGALSKLGSGAHVKNYKF